MIKMVIVDFFSFFFLTFSLGGSDDENGDLLGGYSCNEDDFVSKCFSVAHTKLVCVWLTATAQTSSPFPPGGVVNNVYTDTQLV